MFFDGFSSKTNHLLRANMSYCYEKIITISPKLATLASGQILTHFLMIHRYTHTHTHTHTHTQMQGVPIYMEDFILPCNNCKIQPWTKTISIAHNVNVFRHSTRLAISPDCRGLGSVYSSGYICLSLFFCSFFLKCKQLHMSYRT